MLVLSYLSLVSIMYYRGQAKRHTQQYSSSVLSSSFVKLSSQVLDWKVDSIFTFILWCFNIFIFRLYHIVFATNKQFSGDQLHWFIHAQYITDVGKSPKVVVRCWHKLLNGDSVCICSCDLQQLVHRFLQKDIESKSFKMCWHNPNKKNLHLQEGTVVTRKPSPALTDNYVFLNYFKLQRKNKSTPETVSLDWYLLQC